MTRDSQVSAAPGGQLLRRALFLLITIAGVAIIALASHPASKDYISYWSSAHLFAHHVDPYSPSRVLAIEQANGYDAGRPLIMRNPPWAIPLVLPLGFLSPVSGLILWTLIALGCIAASVSLLEVPRDDRILAFFFAPAMGALMTGQSSPLLLLGFVLFLRFYERRPFLAGASLLLLAIKPHLFLVFWLVLVIDSARHRRFRLLAGLASSIAASSAIITAIDPQIWREYLAMMRSSSLGHEFFPTLSMMFRVAVDARAEWLLFAPSLAAAAWGCFYYVRHRSAWDWRTHGLLLMLVTVLASPYAWFSDEIVLLPCIVFAVSLRRQSLPALVAINSVALVLLLAWQPTLNSGAYLWTTPAWLAWYLYARSPRRVHATALVEDAATPIPI